MLTPWLLAACAPEPDRPGRSERPSPDPGEEVETPAPEAPREPDTRGDLLFDESLVHEVRIELGEAGVASLRIDPRAWVPADVTVDGTTVPGAGVRLKGGGSFRTIDDKPSFKIELDRYEDDAELDGLDELVLNNAVLDPSMLHERTAYHAYRLAGLPAPRAVHATLEVDGEPYGLYTLVEATDGRFLDRWYADDEGPMFEMFDVDFRTEDVPRFDHDGGPDDRTALYGLAAALADPDATVDVDVARWIDLDAFLRYFATSAVIGQFDAYPYSFPGDDVVLYVDPADGRIDVLPHGADETFSDPERPVDYVFGLLAKACLDDVDCEWTWKQEVFEVEQLLSDADLRGYVTDVGAQIAQPMQDDPKRPYRIPEVVSGRDAVLSFLDTRRARLQDMPGLD